MGEVYLFQLPLHDLLSFILSRGRRELLWTGELFVAFLLALWLLAGFIRNHVVVPIGSFLAGLCGGISAGVSAAEAQDGTWCLTTCAEMESCRPLCISVRPCYGEGGL